MNVGYFAGYPSKKMPVLFSFCVKDVLTSSPEVCLVHVRVAVSQLDHHFRHK